MPDYYIEMGQGIIARGNMCVFTSQLYSCTFIAAVSRDGRSAGAFHYPSGNQDHNVQTVAAWLRDLDPSQIYLVYAEAPLGYEHIMGSPENDRRALRQIIDAVAPHARVTPRYGSSAYANCRGGWLEAGSTEGAAYSRNEGNEWNVEAWPAGEHLSGQVTVYGSNQQPRAPVPVPVVQWPPPDTSWLVPLTPSPPEHSYLISRSPSPPDSPRRYYHPRRRY